MNGVLFTGSVAGGLSLRRALVDEPGKILALEMGGNNPLVIWDVEDIHAAAYLALQSAFITSGQRCSCARRLIIPEDDRGDAIIKQMVEIAGNIRIGTYDQSPEPFMGPVISDASAESLLNAQDRLISTGGSALMKMRVVGGKRAMLSPGIIDVSGIPDRPDTEYFGPLLQLIRVRHFESAIVEANRTQYGLTAALFSDDRELWDEFFWKVRAGVVCWNRQTTGSSSLLPFGGIGLSGNHRPSGYFASDYCSYPVASMEVSTLTMPITRTPGIG